MPTKIKLDPAGRSIEEDRSKYVPVPAGRRARIEQILERARKTRNTNVHISDRDLMQLKGRAEDEGIPCQPLVSSVWHKHGCEKLLEEEDILKSVELLGSRRQPRDLRPNRG